MDPRHKLYKNLDNLTISSETPNMSARTDAEAENNAANSGVTIEGIKQKLQNTLDASHVEVEDLSGGCGQMFEAIIVSPQFTKKTTLARHRLVNAALKEEIAAIHAWTPKCHTPEEWEKKKNQA